MMSQPWISTEYFHESVVLPPFFSSTEYYNRSLQDSFLIPIFLATSCLLSQSPE